MSRTTRNIPSRYGPLLPNRRTKRPPIEFIQEVPDGKRDFTVELIRDNRCTGLRSHRADRQKARVMLKHDVDDDVPAGKMRRYSLQYRGYIL